MLHFRSMPTVKGRYPVTETEEVAADLDEAARHWRGVPRDRLIHRVLVEWRNGGSSAAARVAARRRFAGSLPGSSALYDTAHDWPA